MTSAGEVTARIILVTPPAGVLFCVQRGRDTLVGAVRSPGSDLVIAFPVQLRWREDAPDFGGPFVQGRSGGRFVYVNSGKRAGDANSSFDRRAKVPLTGITWASIDQLKSTPGAVLEVRIAGKSKDGGPVCATVPLLDGGWRIVG